MTGQDNDLEEFPSADDLWSRLRTSEGIVDEKTAERRAVQAVLQSKHRVLLTLATGTGKTVIAFQICYKLWSSRWNRTGEHRRPRILFLADRNVLVDDPKDKTFAPFGNARWKISGEAKKSREMYSASTKRLRGTSIGRAFTGSSREISST